MVIMLIFPFIIPIQWCVGAWVRACMCICVKLLPIYEIIWLELEKKNDKERESEMLKSKQSKQAMS